MPDLKGLVSALLIVGTLIGVAIVGIISMIF